MVLCIASVRKVGANPPSTTNVSTPSGAESPRREPSSIELELTDGWYSAYAQVDRGIQRLVETGKLFIGQKIGICGARLCSNDAIPILQALTSEARLFIGRNSIRLIPWWTKLGFCRAHAFSQQLRSIDVNGGLIPAIEVWVLRVYPMCFIEDAESGKKVTRTRREQEHYVANYPADSNSNKVPSQPPKFSSFLRTKVWDASCKSSAMITIWQPYEGIAAKLAENTRVQVERR